MGTRTHSHRAVSIPRVKKTDVQTLCHDNARISYLQFSSLPPDLRLCAILEWNWVFFEVSRGSDAHISRSESFRSRCHLVRIFPFRRRIFSSLFQKDQYILPNDRFLSTFWQLLCKCTFIHRFHFTSSLSFATHLSPSSKLSRLARASFAT